jgi:protein-S-isoprenylcysteine O-methyltransferase Ste14
MRRDTSHIHPLLVTNEILWRYVPLLHALMFGTVAVSSRIFLAWKRGISNPVSFTFEDDAQNWLARGFYVWLPAADGAFLVVYSPTGAHGPFVLEGLTNHHVIQWIGVVCLVVSLVWVVGSQAAMGNSRRMGVNDNARTELITGGPFAISRHPAYLGIRGTMTGQLLVLPTWPVLVFWVVSELLVQMQARFEEMRMLGMHETRYAAYCARVRRWL